MKINSCGKIGISTSFIIYGGSGKCQEEINKEIDNNSNDYTWIQLKRILQNIKGKGIATLLGKISEHQNDVLVKVQLKEEALNEYKIQQRIKDIDGIVPYNCFVTCGGDKKYIEDYGPPLKPYQKLCTKKGSELGIIIMQFFHLGSFEIYLKEKSINRDPNVVKVIICKSIYILFKLYRAYGFTHGDFFSKNIILRSITDPLLIDFEKSSFNEEGKLSLFWRDIDCLLMEVSGYIFKNELSEISNKYVIISRAYNKEPTPELISEICKDLQKIKI